MYFPEVCVVFSRARIAFPKNVEIKHSIYFDWPKELLILRIGNIYGGKPEKD